MSENQLTSDSKTLGIGKQEILGNCFNELRIETLNKGDLDAKASVLETSDYFALRIESLNNLLLKFSFPDSLVSFIYKKNDLETLSPHPIEKSLSFNFSEFNFSTAKEFQLQSSSASEYIFLLIRESEFVNFLNPSLKSHQEILARIKSKKDWLFPDNFNLSFSIRHLLENLLSTDKNNPFGRLFFQSRILEVYAKLFEFIEQEASNSSPQNCTWTRLKPLIAAKKIIEENLASPPSLSELSKMVGINDYDLKKGFKEQFGRTVFGYLGEQRMTLAYELLKNKSQTIGEISSIVGYKNPQHFSSAFKKRFGLNPSQIMD